MASAPQCIYNVIRKTYKPWDELGNEFYNDDKFSDIVVRVGDETFHLHRIILCLKSNYFEKFLTTNMEEITPKEIEINNIQKETFSDVIKVMYGYDLYNVLTNENFASLFIALDYFQMKKEEEDIEMMEVFIYKIFNKTETKLFRQMFQLHNYLLQQADSSYVTLLYLVRTYMLKHLSEIEDTEYFLHLPLDEIKSIITLELYDEEDRIEAPELDQVCAKWICFDLNKRLEHIVTLANAVNYRCNDLHLKTSEKEFPKRLYVSKDKEISLRHVIQDNIYVLRILDIEPEQDPNESNDCYSPLPSEYDPDEISLPPEETKDGIEKLKTYFINEYFCDISVKVGRKTFRLHRIILSSVSEYFREFFSNPSNLHSREIQLPDEIDEITFEWIIRYMYDFHVQLNSKTNFIRLLEAYEFFKIEGMLQSLQRYIKDYWTVVNEIIEVLNFAAKKSYSDLYRSVLTTITQNISETKSLPNFGKISLHTLKEIFSRYSNICSEEEAINICAKWICYNIENRYCCIPDVVLMITGNSKVMSRECKIHYERLGCESCDEKKMEKILAEICNRTKLVPVTTCGSVLNDEEKPVIMFSSPDYKFLTFKNSNFENIETFRMPPSSKYRHFTPPIFDKAATILGDNLFLTFNADGRENFNVFNFSTKKINRLVSHDSYEVHRCDGISALLNCNDRIYSCSPRGTVWEYSATLNRWFVFGGKSYEPKNYKYTSDDKRLFRLHTNHLARVYADFCDPRMKSWCPLPELQNMLGERVQDITIIDKKLCVVTPHHTTLFDERSHTWVPYAHHIIEAATQHPTILSNPLRPRPLFSKFKQNNQQILSVIGDMLFSFSPSSKEWVLRSETMPKNFEMVHFN